MNLKPSSMASYMDPTYLDVKFFYNLYVIEYQTRSPEQPQLT